MNNYKQEKLKIKLEEIAKKVEQMPAQDKEIFIAQLRQELRLLQARQVDALEHGEKLDRIPRKKKMSDKTTEKVICGSTFIGCLAGIGVALTYDEAVLLASLSYMVAGGGLGFFAAIVNRLAWEERPISNKVNEFRKYLTEKKISRLQDKIDSKKYLGQQLGEMEL